VSYGIVCYDGSGQYVAACGGPGSTKCSTFQPGCCGQDSLCQNDVCGCVASKQSCAAGTVCCSGAWCPASGVCP
jgi:hypothetical protein